mgnify:CR=1 FL=1
MLGDNTTDGVLSIKWGAEAAIAHINECVRKLAREAPGARDYLRAVAPPSPDSRWRVKDAIRGAGSVAVAGVARARRPAGSRAPLRWSCAAASHRRQT